jgi:hypothetical protein
MALLAPRSVAIRCRNKAGVASSIIALCVCIGRGRMAVFGAVLIRVHVLIRSRFSSWRSHAANSFSSLKASEILLAHSLFLIPHFYRV